MLFKTIYSRKYYFDLTVPEESESIMVERDGGRRWPDQEKEPSYFPAGTRSREQLGIWQG